MRNEKITPLKGISDIIRLFGAGLALLLLLVLFPVSGFAQRQSDRPWWYTLEEGKFLFRSGAYGDALITFEDARRERLAQFTRMEEDFIRLLSRPDVRRLGDSLEFVEMYIAVNLESTAASALDSLFHYLPRNSFDGSAARALEGFSLLKNYPEAEYWLGETYRMEGELSLALLQYERALNNKNLFEVPGFDSEILYKMTEIHRLRQEYQEMERRAKEVIEGVGPSGEPRDVYWARNQTRSSMSRLLENEGINTFLTLYRHRSIETERAHRFLGLYYFSSSRYNPSAEHLMFSFLIQNTVIIEEIIRRQFDFTFSTLENLEAQARLMPELTAFQEQTEYYRTAYYLASALYASGKTRPAREIWNFLARSVYAGEWGERARRNPNPYIERAVELP